jgi:acyl carrier protein
MFMMKVLESEIKHLIIDTLELEGVSPLDISAEMSLFDSDFGLDSIDALELGVALKKKYRIEIAPDSEDLVQHFYSVATMSAFVAQQRNLI